MANNGFNNNNWIVDQIFDDEEEDAAVLHLLRNLQHGNAERQLNVVNVNMWRVLGDPTFQTHFRMNRSTFEILIVAVGEHLESENRANFTTPLDVSLMMGLWIICNGDTFRTTAVMFGTSKGVVYFHYKRLVRVLTQLSGRFIAWPNQRGRDIIQHQFEERYRYPGVAGAIDGTHLYVTAPLEQPRRYVNRHHTYSILAQAVCDHRKLFRDVYIGEPGSVGDIRMFSRSPLRDSIFTRPHMLRQTEHILGDSAYPLSEKVLIPFPHNSQDPRERFHNRYFSKCRSIIERAFGLLKNKFSRLRYFRSRNLNVAIWHIMSCFVLHNFILLEGVPLALDADIVQWPQPHGGQIIDDNELEHSRELGAIKREYILTHLERL